MPVVLVVDDGAANREVIRLFLSTIDCEVRLAEDGPTALDMIETAPPDLVLLDVRMPRMDGYEVCRRIKAMPRGRLLPVVMITGLSQTTHRVMALEAGADDFMAKPVEGAELIARVRSALRLKELYNTLDSAEHVIFSLATAVEAKDSFTEQHTHPDGRRAREIPRAARIVSVCDAFDALVNDRPYRMRRSTEEALAVLRAGSGTQWDPETVDLLASELPAIQHLGAA